MKEPRFPYHIFPLGDSALTIDFGNRMDEAINRQVIARFHQLRHQQLPGLVEVVPAFSSLAVYYDPVFIRKWVKEGQTAFDYVSTLLLELLRTETGIEEEQSRLVRLPVCYDPSLAPDLEEMAKAKVLSVEQLTTLHTGRVYRVYMLGFLPGFAYMGEVDEQIMAPRKQQPHPVRPGSVGIAGRQTGIYPFASPGGWNIIGRTPVQLFNRNRALPTLLQAGDRVQFYAIDKYEFAHY